MTWDESVHQYWVAFRVEWSLTHDVVADDEHAGGLAHGLQEEAHEEALAVSRVLEELEEVAGGVIALQGELLLDLDELFAGADVFGVVGVGVEFLENGKG